MVGPAVAFGEIELLLCNEYEGSFQGSESLLPFNQRRLRRSSSSNEDGNDHGFIPYGNPNASILLLLSLVKGKGSCSDKLVARFGLITKQVAMLGNGRF